MNRTNEPPTGIVRPSVCLPNRAGANVVKSVFWVALHRNVPAPLTASEVFVTSAAFTPLCRLLASSFVVVALSGCGATGQQDGGGALISGQSASTSVGPTAEAARLLPGRFVPIEVKVINGGSVPIDAGTEHVITHVFARGHVPVGFVPVVRSSGGLSVASQLGGEAYWDGGANADGSLRFARISLQLPQSIPAGASASLIIAIETSPPSRTGVLAVDQAIASLQAAQDYQVRHLFPAGTDEGTWVASRNHALAGPQYSPTTGYGRNPDRGWRVVEHGPVGTLIYWWTKMYRAPTSSDYHHQLRGGGYVYYWHASARVQDSARTGLPNTYGPQGVAGSPAWENKLALDVSVWRGSTKLREFLSSDQRKPMLGKATAFWWADADASWDWSDGRERLLFNQWDRSYAQASRVIPKFDWSAGDTPAARVAYRPSTVSSLWPRDLHSAGDGSSDARIGAVSLYSLRTMRTPGDIASRVNERIAVFGLPGAWHVNENTGLMPVKGDPSITFGTLGAMQRLLSRTNIWSPSVPAAQLRDHDIYFGTGDNDRVWYGRYADGVIEASHWPNLWFAYAVSGDVRIADHLAQQDHSLLLNLGGVAGVAFGIDNLSKDSKTDNPATGAFALSLRMQPRGTGWLIRQALMGSLFGAKYEYDHASLVPETSYWKWRLSTETNAMLAEADWYRLNLPGEFPAVWGTQQKFGINSVGTDSKGRSWSTPINYMHYHQTSIIAYVALADDIGSVAMRNYYNGRMEKLMFHWLANQQGCDYFFTSFNGYAGYWGSRFENTSTDSSLLKQAITEALQNGAGACPVGLSENASGVPSLASQALGIAAQAGLGTYDTPALWARLQQLRLGTKSALKYSAMP